MFFTASGKILYTLICKTMDEHKYCHICRVQLKATDIHPNDFFVSCESHKEQAQQKAEEFFQQYPQAPHWQNIQPDYWEE